MSRRHHALEQFVEPLTEIIRQVLVSRDVEAIARDRAQAIRDAPPPIARRRMIESNLATVFSRVMRPSTIEAGV